MEKRQKIKHYLKSNYRFLDQNVLQLWASYLDNERYVKQKKEKLVWTAQGAQEMSRHLSHARKQRTRDFKIQLKGLLHHVPNDIMIFENAKHHPMFPVLVFYVYIKNKHVYDAFHRKYPMYPQNETVLNSLLQQDEMWVDKYRAGELYSDLSIRFMSSFAQTHIVFSVNLLSEQTLFKAELRKNTQVLSTITCPCPEKKKYIDLKLSLLAMFLMTYDYDKSSLLQTLTRELQNFSLLVPDFVAQFTALCISKQKINDIIKELKHTVVEFKKSDTTLSTLLFQNFESWPFKKISV